MSDNTLQEEVCHCGQQKRSAMHCGQEEGGDDTGAEAAQEGQFCCGAIMPLNM